MVNNKILPKRRLGGIPHRGGGRGDALNCNPPVYGQGRRGLVGGAFFAIITTYENEDFGKDGGPVVFFELAEK